MPEASDDARIEVHFRGPMSWPDSPECPSVFSDPTGQQSGIYLWTVEFDRGHLVYYVGMTTRSFSVRMREHLREYLSGMYGIYDISQFREGRKESLWEGMWRQGEEKRYPAFLSRHEELWPHLWGMITEMRLQLGALEEADKRVMERIEAGIAENLYQQPGQIGDFQEPGIQYRGKRPEEAPLRASLQADVTVLGLPSEIQV